MSFCFKLNILLVWRKKQNDCFLCSKGEQNLAGFFPPNDQNSFCKNNWTNSKFLRNCFLSGWKNGAKKNFLLYPLINNHNYTSTLGNNNKDKIRRRGKIPRLFQWPIYQQVTGTGTHLWATACWKEKKTGGARMGEMAPAKMACPDHGAAWRGQDGMSGAWKGDGGGQLPLWRK